MCAHGEHGVAGDRVATEVATVDKQGLVTGVRRAVAGLRWQGLALFGIVVAKVFLVDLSYLSGGYRVLSSIVLGIVLLAVSFLYQRGLAAQAAR